MIEDKIKGYKWFFYDQLRQMELELKTIVTTPIAQLISSGNVNIGYIDKVIQQKGHIIIKFPQTHAPRLKVLKNFVIIKKKAFQDFGTHPRDWKCTLKEFRGDALYHTIGSDLFPLYYHPSNDGYVHIECSSVSLKLYALIEQALKEGKNLSVLVCDPFPPMDYLQNLVNYMNEFPNNKELLLEPKIQYEDWHPEELSFKADKPNEISEIIYDTLEKEDCCILQGPPGTGKSYVIATIISRYLESNKTVCATTMANKGLMELILQKPLNAALEGGKISKTNLAIDESERAKGLTAANKDLLTPSGHLICATNYTLSGLFEEMKDDNSVDVKKEVKSRPHYDLVVIEEASQAFLTAIAAFKSLGTKCLIVGDPMQLPPIVKSLNKPQYKLFNSTTQIEGMTTYALGTDIKAYRIVSSHRLTARSAELTGMFYNNRLTSVNRERPDFSKINDPHLLPNGGVVYEVTNDVRNSLCSETAIRIIGEILDKFKNNYPDAEVAIIAPFRDTVKELQKHFSIIDSLRNLTVETVDRIQGMTVDYSIMYFPGWKPSFALEQRRFNVATSRSRTTTLLLSDVPLEELHSAPETVIPFVERCSKISIDDKTINLPPEVVDIIEQENDRQSAPTDDLAPTPTLQGVKVVGKIDLSKYERPKKEIKPGKQNYYIIDTNVFVNCPDILDKIDKEYPIILSAKVTDELDKMKVKLDEKSKQNAEKALRLLNRESKHKIIYEFADVSLLPDDFNKKSPDNMILSVALKYKDDNPIMLTSDNGLQLKSKIFGITTISLKDFLRKR